jgi:hypothetical protein
MPRGQQFEFKHFTGIGGGSEGAHSDRFERFSAVALSI